MVNEEELETWVWPEKGVKPDPEDAIYSAGDQPISEFDNHVMWAITKDLRQVNENTGKHSDTHEHGGDDIINLDGLSAGINTSPQITETDTPAGFAFQAGEKEDLHLKTEVDIENSGSTGTTDDVTVTLYDGSDAGGTALVTETKQGITISAGETVSLTFLDIQASDTERDGISLADGDHYIDVDFDANDFSAVKTTEFLYAGEWTLWETDGDFSLTDHWGEDRLCFDGETGEITCLAEVETTLELGEGMTVNAGQVDLQSSPLTGKGHTIWNPTREEVPQPRLGGPASELQYGYPLDGRDMQAGEGSNINADLLRGYTPQDLMDDVSGKWTYIADVSVTDTDASSPVDFDTGVMDTTYDIYRIEVYLEDQRPSGDGGQTYLSCRINNSQSKHYTYDYYDSYANEHYSRSEVLPYNNRQWGHIASTLPAGMATHELVIKCPEPISAPADHYPLIGSLDLGAGLEDLEFMEMGSYNDSVYPVERIGLYGTVDATAKIAVYGRNLQP